MSLELQQSTGGRPALDLLLHLDLESERLKRRGADASVTVGPFRAFSVSTQPADSCSPPSSGSSDHVVEDIPLYEPQVDDGLLDCDADDILNIFPAQHDEAALFMPQSSPGQPFPELDMAIPDDLVLDHGSGIMTTDLVIPPAMPPGGGSHEHSLPADASFILRYCRANSKNTSASRTRLSPWEKAFMPCAVETFGELTLWNTTSCARFTVFYAILASTAFRIHRSDRSSSDLHWLNTGKEYQKIAKNFLREALKTEVAAGPCQGKYNELLLAVLSIIMSSVRALLSSAWLILITQ